MHRKQLRTFLFPIRPAYRFPPAPKAAKRKQRNFIMRRQNKGKIVSEGDGGVRPPRERMSRTELSWAELSRNESSRGGGRVTCVRLAATAAKHDPLCGSKPHFNPCCLSFCGRVATGNGNCLAMQRAFAADKDTPRTTPNVEHSTAQQPQPPQQPQIMSRPWWRRRWQRVVRFSGRVALSCLPAPFPLGCEGGPSKF